MIYMIVCNLKPNKITIIEYGIPLADDNSRI